MSALATTSSVRLRLATNCEQAEALRPAWEAVLLRQRLAGPRAEPHDLLAVCAADAGVRPHVALFENGQGPVGLLVGKIEHRPVYCRFGYARLRTPSMVCMEIVYGGLHAHGAEAGRAVIRHLDTLLRGGAVDHVMINHLPADDPLADELTRRFHRRLVVRSVQKHHRFDLATDYDELMKRFSGKTRSTNRRKERILAERFGGHVSMETCRTPAELERFLPRAAAVAARTYQAGLGVALADTPRWRALLGAQAAAGKLRGYLLYGGDEPIAFELGILCGTTFVLETLGYLPEYRELSPGGVLLQKTFADLCADGVKAVDYGFGDADYKRIYGSASWDELVLHLYGHSLRAGLGRTLDTAVTAAALQARRLAERMGGLARLKKQWRQRLQRGAVQHAKEE